MISAKGHVFSRERGGLRSGTLFTDSIYREINRIMNIRPLYDRIVVKRIEEQETTRNGIVIPDSAKEKPQEGEVMAIGKGKRLDDGTMVALDVHVGDRILFGKYSGNEIKLDGTEYIIMREEDVLGVLDAAPQALSKAS
jgi:chaperonin GroES